MKNVTATICLLVTCFAMAQNKISKDPYKNKGYFNITKYTRYHVNAATLYFEAADNGTTESNVKGNAYGNSLQTINGYFLSPKFSLGLGVGLENFTEPNANTTPVFLDARYYLEDNYNSFYGYANAGVLAKLGNTFRSGGLIGAGIGYKFFIDSDKKIALMTDVGYYHRLIDIPFENNPNTSDLILNGFQFSLGVIF